MAVIPSNRFNSAAVEDTNVSEPDAPICNAAVLTALVWALLSNITALLACAVPAVVTST